jgi:hypothetical protein
MPMVMMPATLIEEGLPTVVAVMQPLAILVDNFHMVAMGVPDHQTLRLGRNGNEECQSARDKHRFHCGFLRFLD